MVEQALQPGQPGPRAAEGLGRWPVGTAPLACFVAAPPAAPPGPLGPTADWPPARPAAPGRAAEPPMSATSASLA